LVSFPQTKHVVALFLTADKKRLVYDVSLSQDWRIVFKKDISASSRSRLTVTPLPGRSIKQNRRDPPRSCRRDRSRAKNIPSKEFRFRHGATTLCLHGWLHWLFPLAETPSSKSLNDSDRHFKANKFVQGEYVLRARIGNPLPPSMNRASRDAEKRHGSLESTRLHDQPLKQGEQRL
jgi:hypothetical protein